MLLDRPAVPQHTPPESDPRESSVDRFCALFERAIGLGTFSRLVLARNRVAASDLKRVSVRHVVLRDRPALSFVFTHADHDLTRNTTIDEGVARVRGLLAADFAHAHLSTSQETVELRISRKGQQTLRRARVLADHPNDASGVVDGRSDEAVVGRDEGARFEPASASDGHDRQKRRFVDIERRYLVDLGVTDEAHRLVPAMARKWKQINKFVEIFDHAVRRAGLVDDSAADAGPHAGEGGSNAASHATIEGRTGADDQARAPIRVADFGCGKGYLTFAVHDHLRRALGLETRTTGVEWRPALVDLCNDAARRSALAGLQFVAGDLRSHVPEALDVVIALHACDTATDDAIHLALRAGARVIMCSPCCHKELRPQMTSPSALAPMLRHGVHLGQQAEMVTDSLRALLLEAEGYDAQVFEFVALEHTSKNKMILAVKREPSAATLGAMARARVEIDRIKSFYAIREQRLESLLHPTAQG